MFLRFNDVLKLDEKVLESVKRTLHRDRPNLLTAMNNLAADHHSFNRMQEALEPQEIVAQRQKQTSRIFTCPRAELKREGLKIATSNF